MEKYDTEERERSKEEKVLLITSVRDPMISEGAAEACANRRDTLSSARFCWNKCRFQR